MQKCWRCTWSTWVQSSRFSPARIIPEHCWVWFKIKQTKNSWRPWTVNLKRIVFVREGREPYSKVQSCSRNAPYFTLGLIGDERAKGQGSLHLHRHLFVFGKTLLGEFHCIPEVELVMKLQRAECMQHPTGLGGWKNRPWSEQCGNWGTCSHVPEHWNPMRPTSHWKKNGYY